MSGLLIAGILLFLVFRAVSWWRRTNVAIFWDCENCPIPKGEDPSDVVKRVHQTAKNYGTLKVFKAYSARQQEIANSTFRNALQKHKVNFITCPYSGNKQDVDNKIKGDMLIHANKARKTTFVLISSDSDFIQTVLKLQEHGHKVVVITQFQQGSPKLRSLASVALYWEKVASAKA